MNETGLGWAEVARLVMPDVSRAIRARRYSDARTILGRVITDPAQLSRTLAALIQTEPRALSWL